VYVTGFDFVLKGWVVFIGDIGIRENSFGKTRKKASQTWQAG
jgi:hypothetical protein